MPVGIRICTYNTIHLFTTEKYDILILNLIQEVKMLLYKKLYYLNDK